MFLYIEVRVSFLPVRVLANNYNEGVFSASEGPGGYC